MHSKMNIEKLINITVDVVMKNSLNNLCNYKPTRRGEKSNVWNIICFNYYGSINYNNALKLFTWWQRDTQNYSSLTKKAISELEENESIIEKMDICSSEKKIVISFSSTEWESIKCNIATYKKRSKFKSEFSHILSEKIQKNDVKCWLKCDYNWFRKMESQKLSSPFWKGRYLCIECKKVFTASIPEEMVNSNGKKYVIMFIVSQEDNIHNEKIKPKVKCNGEIRSEQAKELMYESTSNVVSKNVLQNKGAHSFLDLKSTNAHLLNNIRYEFKNRNKLSNDHLKDAETAKLLTDHFVSSHSLCKGFIRELGLNPFGFLIISYIHLEIWKIVKEQMPIIFFDSTGSVHREVPNQKKSFLYSLVFHDTTRHQVLPLAEFINTAHDQTSIGKYLTIIKNVLEQNNIDSPKIIVTDQSWALINSILLVFNNCNILNYLNFCFLFLTGSNKEKLKNIIKVKYYLCSTHFFKNIKKKVKKLDVDKDIKTLFLFSFTLLINSINLEQIDKYLKNIHNIFCNKYYDITVRNSLEFIRRELKNNSLDDFDIEDSRLIPDELNRDKEFEEFLKETNIYIDMNYSDSIRINSPFTNFYNAKMINFSIELTKRAEENRKNYAKENKLFNEKLFKIIRDELYLIPIWSGIMIANEKISYKVKTRLSNNPVENHFSIIKNKVLNKNKFLSTSEIVSYFFKHLYSRYIRYYNINSEGSYLTFNQNVIEEIWVDKNIKPKKIKNFYYNNFDIYGLKALEFPDINEKMEVEEHNSENVEIHVEQNIFLNSDKLKMFKNLMKTIEQPSVSFNLIRKTFCESKALLDEYLNELARINDFTIFDNHIINHDFKDKLKLSDDFYPINSTGNGNCLYNSISLLLFGIEDLFYLIKICSIYTIIQNEVLFNNLLIYFKYEQTLENFIKKTCKKNEYASSLNIFSLCLLLNKTIFCFVESKMEESNVKHIYSFKRNSHNKILIGYYNEHFFPILTKSKTNDFKKSKDLNDFNFEERCMDF